MARWKARVEFLFLCDNNNNNNNNDNVYCAVIMTMITARVHRDVVSESTVKGANIPQLVGTEDGKIIVDTYDWQSF